ncbi:MAG: ParA family protein [Gemmataceae bacterium]
MRTLLVASQKGGVGKTTTAVNLATLAAAGGARVLLLDADPLGSVTASLQLTRDENANGPKFRPDGVTRQGTIWSDVLPRLDVLSPYPMGDTSESHLQAFTAGLAASPVPRFYDRLIIDAPPMLGPRPKALLKIAEEVLVVQRAEPMSFRTLPAYLELIQEVRNEGIRVKLIGVLMTLASGQVPGSKMETKLRQRFPGLLPQVIPHAGEVNKALVLGQPVSVMAPDCAVSKQYRSLAATLGLTADVAKPVAAAAAATTKKAVPVGSRKGGSDGGGFQNDGDDEVSVSSTPTPTPNDTPAPSKRLEPGKGKKQSRDPEYATAGDSVSPALLVAVGLFAAMIAGTAAWWFMK